MFDLEAFLDDCRTAARDTDPRAAIRGLLQRTLEHEDEVADAIGKDEGGIDVLYNADDITVLNVIWAPHMTIYPHEHRMWATIGIYGGTEENRLFRRGTEQIQPAGEKVLDTRDVFSLGADAIHAVHNPCRRYTGAIHIYGGDFVHEPRSTWDPDTLLERPWEFEDVRRQFALANEEWRAQLGQDLDEFAE